MTQAEQTVWLNGDWVPLSEAHISPLDRGFLFGDAVYEVIPISDDVPLLIDAHLDRLSHSLTATRIPNPHSPEDWRAIVAELVRRHDSVKAVYIHISRGQAHTRSRDVDTSMQPTVFALTLHSAVSSRNAAGCSAIVLPDNRWMQCDIKATSMLANVMLEMQTADAGADEAILIRDGLLTEGTSSSVIVVENGTLIARPNGPELLPGTTVRHVLDLAAANGIAWREETVDEQRLRAADEIWLMSATREIMPVIELDGQPVGTGKAGPLCEQLTNLFADWKQAQINQARKESTDD